MQKSAFEQNCPMLPWAVLSSSACVCEGSFGVSVQTLALCLNGIVGRDLRELCHLDPFVMVRQHCSHLRS